MNKLKFNCFWKTKIENNSSTVQIFFNLQNHSSFHSKEKVGQLSKKKRVLCWSIVSILLVYACNYSECSAGIEEGWN